MIKLLTILIAFTTLSTIAVDKKDWEEIHGLSQLTEKDREEAQKKIVSSENDFKTLVKTAEKTNLALRAIIKIGTINLRKKGYYAEAYELETEWKQWDGKLPAMIFDKNIGDFKPLSDWLALAYEILELKLGKDVCETLRLTDIKTINYCVVVVFKPCVYGYSNFYDHFVTDHVYKGLAPVVSYWATVITCDIVSYGTGYFFICSPIGMLVERAMLNRISPWLAPKIYDRVCGM